MSSWVPVRPAPSEPLCSPSTSYAAPIVFPCKLRLGDRRNGDLLRRDRALGSVLCQAAQALRSYHNAYKLLQQSGRRAAPSPPPEPGPAVIDGGMPQQEAQEQQQQQRQSKRHRPRLSRAKQPRQSQQLQPELPLPAMDDMLQEHAQLPTRPQPQPQPPGPGAHLPQASTHSQRLGLTPAAQDADNGQTAPHTLSSSSSPHSASPPSPAPSRASQRRGADSTAASPSSRLPTNPSNEAFSPLQSSQQQLLSRPYTQHRVELPQWQPPPTAMRARTALTVAIMRCPSYTRLHQLLLENAAEYNSYHTCATLGRVLKLHAAGLSPRESRLFREGCATLQSILRRQLPDMQPRSLVVAAHSLARLEMSDRELLAGLAAAVEPHLRALQPPGLATLLWSFARQAHQPPARWMDAALAAAAAQLPAFAPRDLATLLLSLAQLHYKAAPERMALLLGAVEERMCCFCGRALANVVYSLALSQQHPGEGWLAGAQRRAVQLGPPEFSPQGLTQLTWGLAKLGAAPSPDLLALVHEHAHSRLPLPHLHGSSGGSGRSDAQPHPSPPPRQPAASNHGSTRSARSHPGSQQVQAAHPGQPVGQQQPHYQQQPHQQQHQHQQPQSHVFERRAPRYKGIDLSVLLYSFATWGIQPRPDLGRRLLAALQAELPSLESNQLANCLWACARLKMYPHHAWLRGFFDASYRQLPYFKPVDLSQCLWALARLSACPPAPWLSAAVVRLHVSASLFSPPEVASTLWALAKLGLRGEGGLPAEVLALLFIATDRRLSSFKPQELCSMAWALATMRRRPDKDWTFEFLKVTYHKLNAMNGWCLGTLAWALVELALPLPPAWIYSYVNAARALMQQQAPPPAEADPTAAGAAMQNAAAGDGAAGGSGARMSAMDLAQIITALRKINGGGGSGGRLAKVDEFLAEAAEQLRAMEACSGAYSRQQVKYFLSLAPAHGAAAPPPSYGTAAAATAAVTEPSDVAASTRDADGGSFGNEDGDSTLAAAAAWLAEQRQAAAVDGADGGREGLSSGGGGCRDVTRVLRSGARITLTSRAEVHLEIGELSVELKLPMQSTVRHIGDVAAAEATSTTGSGDVSVSSSGGGSVESRVASHVSAEDGTGKRLLAV